MSSIRIQTVAALLGILLACPAWAQNRANFPWWNNPVVCDLGLSPAQTERIRQIVRSYRERLFDARNATKKAEAELEDMLNNSAVRPESAKPVIDRLANARAKASRIFLQMSIQLRGVLTLGQWRELVK